MRVSLIATFSHACRIVPGVLLAAALALLAKLLTVGAAVSPVLIAVGLGALWRNIIGVHPMSEAGLQWVTQVLLRIGIALVGLKLTLAAAAGIASTALPVAVTCIVTTLAASAVLARVFAIPPRLSHLLAAGTAVCGCTAVVALSPTIRARPEETACALICVVLFGCIGMLCYPWLAARLFAASPLHAGVFLGTAIHDTSQVIGAALIYSQQAHAPDVLAAASATKLIRNLTLAVLIPWAAWRYRVTSASSATSRFCADVLPPFVIAFIVLVILRTIGDALFGDASPTASRWADIIATGHTVAELCLICGMTGVGLSISFAQVRHIGWRAFASGFILAAIVAACSLVLTLMLAARTDRGALSVGAMMSLSQTAEL